jgi:hypothetical protein
VTVVSAESFRLLRCTSCGYDLRGLVASGNCPECGKSIALSSGGDLIGQGNAKWRRRLSVGAMLLTAVMFITGVLHSLVVYQLINSPGWVYWPFHLTPQVQELLSIIAEVLAAVAIWWLTFPDPLQTSHGRSFNLLIVLRIVLLFNFASSIGFRLIGDLIPLQTRIDWGLTTIVPVSIQMFLLYGLLSRLSRRLPDRNLAARFGILRWLKPLAFIYGIGGELYPLLATNNGPDFRPLLPVPGYAMSAVLSFWAAWLLIRFTRGVSRCQISQTAFPIAAAASPGPIQLQPSPLEHGPSA